MPFTSETALSAFKAKGGYGSVRKDEAAGWPRLKKARLVRKLNLERQRLERATNPIVVHCLEDCPCRQKHERQVSTLTPMERAVIAGRLRYDGRVKTKSC